MITVIRPENFSPKFEATGCYIVHEGKVLFMKRVEPEEKDCVWGTAGGTIESGETPLDNVAREIFEETGVIVDKKKLILVGKYYLTYPDFQFIYYSFKYFFEKKPEIALNPEHSEFLWLTPKEALLLDLFLDEDYCIKAAFPEILLE